ncbi:MAG: shikimate kinase, partial [Planktotalea arctica]
LLWSRVRQKATRPLLQTDNPLETLGNLYAARADIYALADITVSASADLSIEDMAVRVASSLRDRADVLECE